MAPEKRLIDAYALMEQIRYYDEREQNELWETSDIEYVVAEQPTMDAAEVVHGHWQYVDDPDEDANIQAYCSVCGAGDRHAASMVGHVPYCWKCGARMELK